MMHSKKAAHVELEAQENMAMNEFTVRSNALKSRQEAELRALTKYVVSSRYTTTINILHLYF